MLAAKTTEIRKRCVSFAFASLPQKHMKRSAICAAAGENAGCGASKFTGQVAV
jgi:hypothetical protein